ncbi:MAG: hypothetical protein ACLPSH_10200 [Vulcanimicrobiaceae bacterium]
MTDTNAFEGVISADWLRAAHAVAIARAARDEHRADCGREVTECPRCLELAALVQRAKHSLCAAQ